MKKKIINHIIIHLEIRWNISTK